MNVLVPVQIGHLVYRFRGPWPTEHSHVLNHTVFDTVFIGRTCTVIVRFASYGERLDLGRLHVDKFPAAVTLKSVVQKFTRAIVCVDHHNYRFALLFTSHFAQEEIKFAAVLPT